jgi:hypothetical protein
MTADDNDNYIAAEDERFPPHMWMLIIGAIVVVLYEVYVLTNPP